MITHVVERCPTCGVEHDEPLAECEACGDALRPWCRRHGRETGWLAARACPRCAAEAARVRAVPAPRPAATPALEPAPPADARDQGGRRIAGNVVRNALLGGVWGCGAAISTGAPALAFGFYGVALGGMLGLVMQLLAGPGTDG